MTDIQRLAFPLRFVDGKAVTVGQDSADHKRDRIAVVCSTPLGSRLDDPTFGIPPMLEKVGPPDIGALAAAIEASEPDIDVHITVPGDEGHENPDAIVVNTRTHSIHVHVLGE